MENTYWPTYEQHTMVHFSITCMFKRLYRSTIVSSIAEIASVVDNSAHCNTSQIVCDEKGSVFVGSFDWSTYLAPHDFKRITNLKKYHHFRFSSESPGIAYLKLNADSNEDEVELLKNSWEPVPHELPPILQPKGLSDERQWYLYEQVCQFCTDDCQDLVCPHHATPNPKRRRIRPEE